MSDEIRALELAHEKASKEYWEAVEHYTKMMLDADSLGPGNPDGMFIRHLAHELKRRATTKRNEALNRVVWAVLRSV